MSGTKLLTEFPPVSTEQWMEVVQKDLKGADFAKKLLWQTDEGITVKPFYRSEDIEGLAVAPAPGEFPYTRGTRPANDWKVRQTIEETNASRANQLALKALASGADEVCYVVGKRGTAVRTAEDVKVLLDGIKAPVHFEAGDEARNVLRLLLKALDLKHPEFEGSVDYSPLDYAAEDRKDAFDEAANLVRAAHSVAPKLRALVIGGYRFHDDGGTAVQELGYALAQAVECVAELTGRGFSADEACSAVTFSFAAGSNFFFEVAKLRAARALWAQAAKGFGAGNEAAKATIWSRASHWNKTVYDPYVNILRGTTAAMSAAMGGCDAMTVAPFDALYRQPEELSRRLARNTQIVLKREALLHRAVDPAGGSYYVEVLTDSLAAAAWKLVQETEAAGGYLKARDAVAAGLKKSREAKQAAVAGRRRSILGTNQYPNLKERMLPQIQKDVNAGSPRAAQVFEKIRLRTERHAANGGKTPLFLLAEAGDVKMRKARSGFSLNFFGCAGFEVKHAICADAGAIVKKAVEKNADAVVLCSSDDEYPKLAAPVVNGLKAAGRTTPVIVAGMPKEAEQLKQDGVADFIHIRSNAAQTLSAWQDKLGVKE